MGALVGKAEMRPRVGVVRCCRLAMNQIWPQWYPIFFGKDSDFNSTPWVKYAPLQRGSHETGALAAEAVLTEALAAGGCARGGGCGWGASATGMCTYACVIGLRGWPIRQWESPTGAVRRVRLRADERVRARFRAGDVRAYARSG